MTGSHLKKGPRKILLRIPNWVGDALLTTPIIHSIRKNLPEAILICLARPWVAPLFESCPDLDGLIHYQKAGPHQGLKGKMQLAQQLREHNFEAAIHFPHSFESAWISYLSRIPIRIGFATEGRGFLLTHKLRPTKALKKEHQVAYFYHLLEPLGLTISPSPRKNPLCLKIPSGDQRQAEARLAGLGIRSDDFLIGLAPGAIYGSAKCWPFDRFEALARKVHQSWQAKVLLLGTAGDALSGSVKESPYYVNLVGKTSLSEVLALMRSCRFMVCNDSGLMHAACALKTPLVALFGPTDAQRTGPWGGLSRLIQKAFPCSPCLKKTCPHPRTCMEAISVAEVWEELKKLKDQMKG
jgi:heptosyltransferase-2